MTNHAPCRYGTDRDRAVVDYLYGETDPGERSAFAAHLDTCALCAEELRELRGVRRVLAGWAPPEPMRALDHGRSLAQATASPRAVAPLATAPASGGSRWAPAAAAGALPAWAQAAAAVLCLGVGLGAANLRISYSATDGLSVRTGWIEQAAPAAALSTAVADNAQPGRTSGAAATAAPAGDAAWRVELASLAEELRSEMRAHAVPAASADAAGDGVLAARDAALLRQVKSLIQRSEERQQQEMALRVGTVLSDIQTQRRSDLARIERTIGVVQNNTGLEVLRQQQMINSLAVRVSSPR